MPLTTVSPGMLDTTAQYYSFKNRIINPAMTISQRAAVNTNVAVGTGTAGTFGPDRFSGYTGTGSLWNISQVSTTAYDFPFALRLQRIAGQTSTAAVYLRQIIETANCKDLAGQVVTLSFYATAGANYSGGAATVQLFTGTAADQGTTSLNTAAWTGLASAINSTFTPTTTRTLFTFTGTLGATTQEVAFSINWSGSGTAGASDFLDITGVQLEKGSTATSFDYRPYGTELALCQRYYAKSYNQSTVPGSNAGTTNSVQGLNGTDGNQIQGFRTPVTMRATATARVWSLSGSLATLSTTGEVNSGVGAGSWNPYGMGDQGCRAIVGNSGLTSGTAYVYHWDASAEL